MKHALALTAVVIAVIALVMSSRNKAVRVASDPGGGESTRLVARLDEIEKRLASIEHQTQAPRLEAPAAGTREVQISKPDGRLDEIAKRLEILERSASAPTRAVTIPTHPAFASQAEIDATIASSRAAGASEAQKLEALRKLRWNKRTDGTEARLEVLDDMIRLAQTSAAGATRADVWRQMSKVTDARLRQPLLDALAFDTHAKAREEAAETLADFMPVGTVEAALRAASTNDADEGVRKQAKESLAGGR